MPEGVVHFTSAAQQHAYDRHGEEFLRCHAYVAQTVSNPTYIGYRARAQPDGFEMILSVPAGGMNILTALTLRPCNYGIYRIKSVYPVDNAKISSRLRNGFLFPF